MEILKFLEGIRSPFFNLIFGLLTRLGEETIAIVAICAIFWCINKRAAYVIGVAYFLSGLTVQGMKVCFRIDRPWIIDPTFNPVPSALEQATGYSFPSGHTQSATTLFGSLGVQIKKKPYKVVCFLLIFLVGFSRMYLGVHTLLDVGVSLLISLFFVFLVYKILPSDTAGKKHEMFLSLLMMVFAVAVIVIAASMFSAGYIEQVYLSDCLKAAGAGAGFAVGMYIERVHIGFAVETKSILLQVIKLIMGIAGVLIIKEGLKLIIGTGLVVDTVRYFFMIIWGIVLFPIIIKRFFAVPTKAAEKN